MTDFIAGCERIDVADDLMAFAHIVSQDIDEVLVDHTALGKFHDRHENAFFINFVRIRAEAASANIDHVGRTGKEASQLALAEAGRHDREVMQMASAFPWVVGDIDVALVDVFATYIVDEVADRFRHGIDVAGGTGNSLRDHEACPVEDTCRKVAGFTHAGAEGGTDESGAFPAKA